MNDLHVIQSARNGDREAKFQLAWSRYDLLYVFVQRKLPSHLRGILSADDILQEVFARAFRGIAELEIIDDESVDRWLRTIAIHRIIDVVRFHSSQRRDDQRTHLFAEPSDSRDAQIKSLIADTPTPSSELRATETTHQVHAALDQLNDEYRQVVQWRYHEELTLAEVAKRRNSSVGAVSMMVSRAMKQLRHGLKGLSWYEE